MAIGAPPTVLGVEVSDPDVAGGTGSEMGIEAPFRSAFDAASARRCLLHATQKIGGGTTLLRRCQGDVRVLAEVVRETVLRSGRKRRLARLQRAEHRAGLSRHGRRHADETDRNDGDRDENETCSGHQGRRGEDAAPSVGPDRFNMRTRV